MRVLLLARQLLPGVTRFLLASTSLRRNVVSITSSAGHGELLRQQSSQSTFSIKARFGKKENKVSAPGNPLRAAEG